MTARLAPATHAVRAVLQFGARRILLGRRLRVALVAVLLVVAAAAIARYAADDVDPTEAVRRALQWGFAGMLVYLLPVLFASGAIAEEIEQRTWPLLAVRPVPRSAFVLGKYLAGCGATVVLLVAGALAVHLVVHLAEPSRLLAEVPGTVRAAGAVALLGALYAAIALFWSVTVPEAATVLTVLHLALVEWAAGALPGWLRFVSMSHFGRLLGDLPIGGLLPDTVPTVPMWIGALAIITETVLFLALAAVVLSRAEMRRTEA
ncbi:MAG: ABC transporter permease [Myxococcota bacterium]|nr:ABC transporter permease [Myxococcota bacterium]MDW8361933.1 ABC transporter permease [Myxococcales bacterium]